MTVKYPSIRVQLTDRDGNAFAIIGAVLTALKRAGVAPDEIKEFQREATSGDYDNLLLTTMRWVDVQ